MTLRTFSSGGGVQSTAALVLSAERVIDFPVHLFSNVGDDSEHPDTLEYVHDHLMPYAERHGIQLLELHRTRRDGTPETLYGRLVKEGSRSLPIPVRMNNGAPGTRSCTMDFKLRVIAKWLKEHGATPEDPAHVGIGFSTDEVERMSNARAREWEVVEYPLVDLRLSRADCMEITRKAGLPPAPKSACWFCPFHRPSTWQEMRRDEPHLFQRAVDLENLLNARRDAISCDTAGVSANDVVTAWEWHQGYAASIDPDDPDDYARVGEEGNLDHGRWVVTGTCPTCKRRRTLDASGNIPAHPADHVYLTRFAKPLEEAISEAQPTLFEDHGGPESCDEGVCFV